MANRSSVFSVFWTVRRWSFVASLHGPGDSVAPNLDQVGISWNGESLSWALIPGVRTSSTCSPKGERLRDSNIGRYPSRFYAGMVCLNLSPIFFLNLHWNTSCILHHRTTHQFQDLPRSQPSRILGMEIKWSKVSNTMHQAKFQHAHTTLDIN